MGVDARWVTEGAEVDDFARVTASIIGAAIEVHRELGPGLLESAYGACLAYELSRRGIAYEAQKPLAVRYRGALVDAGYRIDFLVQKQVIVELKAIEKLERIHEAQLLTYLKLSGCPVGLLINFNVQILKYGIRRISLSPGSHNPVVVPPLLPSSAVKIDR